MNEESAAHQAIQSLYELYADDIFRYAKITLGDTSQAYDVVQEVFLRAFRSWLHYRQDANAKTWLMSIARNCIYDVFRKKRTERNFLSSYDPPQPRDEADVVEAILEIKQLLYAVKQEYRQVIFLRYIEDLSMRETATILGWSEAKVRTTTHRAMKKLREIWGGDAFNEIGSGTH